MEKKSINVLRYSLVILRKTVERSLFVFCCSFVRPMLNAFADNEWDDFLIY